MKFSIIVPVYNGEKFLPKCFDNISSLEYKNLEIIFINDGSSDKSKTMIENFVLKDPRFHFIDKKINSGTGSAYKLAFEAMTGDYISFTDCDDLLSKRMYGELSELIKKYNKPDMIHFGAKIVGEDGRLHRTFSTSNKSVINNNDIIENHFKIFKEPVLCFKVFKKEVFKDIYCPKQATAIDEILTPQLLLKCNTAFYTNQIYFTHVLTKDSVSRIETSEQKIQEEIFALEYVISLFEKERKSLLMYPLMKYLDYLLYTINYLYLKEIKFKHKKIIKKKIIETYIAIKKNNGSNKILFKLKIKVFYSIYLSNLNFLFFCFKRIYTFK